MHYAAILTMTSQILKSAGFTKTKNSQYLKNKILFFLEIKKFIKHQGCFMTKNSFVAEVTFKGDIFIWNKI